MIHLIYAYLILNAVVLRYCLGDGYFKEFNIWGIFIYSLFLVIFGGLAVGIMAIYRTIEFIFKNINEFFQISFFWKYKFTNCFDNITDIQLKRMNAMTVNYHSSSSVRDKIWRYTMKLVNEKYKPV